jgi:hypothetical protein
MPELPKKPDDKLTPQDVASGDILQIVGKGRLVTFAKKDKAGRVIEGELPDQKLELEFVLPNGQHKKRCINNKSYGNLSKVWGANSDEWDGNVVMVAVEDSPQYGEFIVFYPARSPGKKKEINLDEAPF